MEVTCSDCGQRYRIDDSKVPESGFTYITCPRCKGKIRLENPLTAIPTQSISPTDALNAKLEESFDPGINTALIYAEDLDVGKKLQNKLSTLSYETRYVTTPVELTVRFRYHTYRLVFLQQKGPLTPSISEMLQAIHKLPSEVRRETIVFLMTPNGSRNDSLHAFLYGVDMMLSPLDLEQLEGIIKRIQSEKANQYKIFNDCRQRLIEHGN